MEQDESPNIAIKQGINTVLRLDKRPQGFVFIFAESGHGKSLFSESIIEEFHRRGYTILILSDVKNSFEFMHSAFLPKKKYHIDRLNLVGKPMEKKPIQIYHPFTFAMEKNKSLPDINFYGFSLKDLKRPEWSMLSESEFESETIRLLLNASTNLNNSDGLYSFLHNIEDSIMVKKKGKIPKPDWKNFGLRVGSGSAKGLVEVSSYLLPFKKNYFLLPHDSKLKLNWKKILNDNKNYHLFTTAWIDDEKLQHFCILTLFNQIIRNANKLAKKPILVVIPEIRDLTPERPKGYALFLAQGIKKNLLKMRNMGRGICGLFDSQVWSDVDEKVKNSATRTFYGKLGGANDLEKLGKAKRYKREIVETISSMPRNNYFIDGKEDEGFFVGYFPGHGHAEPEYDFFEEYKKEYPDKMKKYTKLYEEMEKFYELEEKKLREKAKKRDSQEKEETTKKPKSEKQSNEIKKLKEDKNKLVSEKKEETKKKCYELYSSGEYKSFNQIGKKLKISDKTVKKYIDEMKEKELSLETEVEDREVPPLGEDFDLPEE
jgi:hypothetical protein